MSSVEKENNQIIKIIFRILHIEYFTLFPNISHYSPIFHWGKVSLFWRIWGRVVIHPYTVEYKQLYMCTLSVQISSAWPKNHFAEFNNSCNSCSRIIQVNSVGLPHLKKNDFVFRRMQINFLAAVIMYLS